MLSSIVKVEFHLVLLLFFKVVLLLLAKSSNASSTTKLISSSRVSISSAKQTMKDEYNIQCIIICTFFKPISTAISRTFKTLTNSTEFIIPAISSYLYESVLIIFFSLRTNSLIS